MSDFDKYIKKAKSKNYNEMNFQGDNTSTMKQNLRTSNNDDDLDLKEKRKQVKLKAAEYIDALNKGDDDVDILQSVIEMFANNMNSMSLNDVEKALDSVDNKWDPDADSNITADDREGWDQEAQDEEDGYNSETGEYDAYK